jgi:uncharacterized protein (TIGR02678 family)
LLDDPAVDLEDLHAGVRNYLFTPGGREKAFSAVEEAGLTVERHADVWLTIDSTRQSTATTFTSTGRSSTAEQAAGIVLARLVTAGADGRRHLVRRSLPSLQRALAEQLQSSPGWARAFRNGPGVEALLWEAVELLEEFGLVRREADEIVPRPAAGRFAVRVVTGSAAANQNDPEVTP